MIVEEILAIIGKYSPVIVDGVAYTNWGQIAAYALIILTTYAFFTLLGRLVIKR